jgi:hypothetical protein
MVIGRQTLMFDGIDNYVEGGPDPLPDSLGKNSPNSPIAGASARRQTKKLSQFEFLARLASIQAKASFSVLKPNSV